MPFDIHQEPFDPETGEYLEEEAAQYQQQLMELFAQSPEALALPEEYGDIVWADFMMEFGFGYLGVSPAQMSRGALEEVLFDLFPRKISAPAEDAPEIIHVLRAFWKFLKREFALPNADACLQVLDDEAIDELQEEMSDPANFGMAKSIVMMGMERGFDMTTEEGIAEWFGTFNTEQEEPLLPSPISLPSAGFDRLGGLSLGSGGGRQADKAKKKKRKMRQASQKKNRRRK